MPAPISRTLSVSGVRNGRGRGRGVRIADARRRGATPTVAPATARSASTRSAGRRRRPSPADSVGAFVSVAVRRSGAVAVDRSVVRDVGRLRRRSARLGRGGRRRRRRRTVGRRVGVVGVVRRRKKRIASPPPIRSSGAPKWSKRKPCGSSRLLAIDDADRRRARGRRACPGRGEPARRLERSVGGRDRDPRDDVRGNADPQHRGDDPEHAHERDVDAVRLGDARATPPRMPFARSRRSAARPVGRRRRRRGRRRRRRRRVRRGRIRVHGASVRSRGARRYRE